MIPPATSLNLIDVTFIDSNPPFLTVCPPKPAASSPFPAEIVAYHPLFDPGFFRTLQPNLAVMAHRTVPLCREYTFIIRFLILLYRVLPEKPQFHALLCRDPISCHTELAGSCSAKDDGCNGRGNQTAMAWPQAK
jgi:hypothetical protein